MDSNELIVTDSLVPAIGYIKASNSDVEDYFGDTVSLSGDGNTLAVGAYREASSATGINRQQFDNSTVLAGAVYVFTRTNGNWQQQAYVKPSNTDEGDRFGWDVSLSADGNTLAIGATDEQSSASGLNGNQNDNAIFYAGAVYVFVRSSDGWQLQAYVKSSNTDPLDRFGHAVSLSADGSSLAVGALEEDSFAAGINGNQEDNSFRNAGAVYLY